MKPYTKISPLPFPFVPRHIRTRDSNYGWAQGAAWFDFCPPPYPSGPDVNGWQGFITAIIYTTVEGFAAISYGCSWKNGERNWLPRIKLSNSLLESMNFCEHHLAECGVFPMDWLVDSVEPIAVTKPVDAPGATETKKG